LLGKFTPTGKNFALQTVYHKITVLIDIFPLNSCHYFTHCWHSFTTY